MKIINLHIGNYKSLEKVDIALNENVNVFIGRNNSGKSNLINAWMFLSSVMSGQQVEDVMNNFGSYVNIIHGKRGDNNITFDMELALSTQDKSSLFPKLNLSPEISLDEFRNGLSMVRYFCEFEINHIIHEEVYICFDDNYFPYAKRKSDSNFEILGSLKEAIRNSEWKLVDRNCNVRKTMLVIKSGQMRREEHLFSLIRDFIGSCVHLDPIRQSQGRMPVRGSFQMTPQASNLPQVLNSIASSNRSMFDKIMTGARDIVGEIEELRASIVPGTQETYISMVEQPFKDEEFTWEHIASGTKEILYLITFLHTTPKGSVLMIEEPEAHLHADAIQKFLSFTEKICKEDDKQVFITTHSPTLIDNLPFEKVFTVVKAAGETKVAPLREGKELERMLSEAGILKSGILQRTSPSFLLIVEGRDDTKIWPKFLERESVDPNRVWVVGSGEPAGGDTKAIEAGKFIKRARISIPFKIVLDSDNEKEKKEEKLKREGFQQNEYHVLSKKEIEDYPLDSKVISGITGKSEKEVNEVITNTSGAGKEKLDKVFENLNLTKPNANVKELLATQVDMPEEISLLINGIKGYLTG